MPHWSSIDHVTMPKLEALASDICSNDLQLEERVEGEEQDNVSKYDYMAEWVYQDINQMLYIVIPSFLNIFHHTVTGT